MKNGAFVSLGAVVHAPVTTVLLALLLGSCRKPVDLAPPLPVRITILGINDFQGAVEERRVMVQTSGGTSVELRLGGAPMLSAYVRRLKGGNPGGTVLLNAGDFWMGSLESNFFEGRPVVMLDNKLGYAAAALGNEFDFGPVGPVSLASTDDPPARRFGALEARRKEMAFPVLAANVRSTEPGAPTFKAWTMVERKGVKIGIVGLSSEDTPSSTQLPNVAGLAFDPPAPALIAAAADARAKGAELVIAVAHLGGECARGSSPDDPDACRKDTEIERTLAAIPSGTVDAVVAGNSHLFIANRMHGVPVIESGSFGQAIGRIELEYDPVTKKVVHSAIFPPQMICRDVLVDTGSCEAPIPPGAARPILAPALLQSASILPDPEVELLLAPFYQEVAEMKAEKLASADRPVAMPRGELSEIGALVTDEMRAATRRLADVPDADFALQNSGGLRAGLPAGEIRYGHVYDAIPFDNALSTVTLTGAQLHSMLTAVLKSGRVFQSSGLGVELRCEKGNQPSSLSLFDHATGKALDPAKSYTVAWNDFLANGGDGVGGSLPPRAVAYHPQYLIRDVVAEGLRTRKTPLNSVKEPVLDPKKPRQRRVGCK